MGVERSKSRYFSYIFSRFKQVKYFLIGYKYKYIVSYAVYKQCVTSYSGSIKIGFIFAV